MSLLQVWLVRLGLVALAALCFYFGSLTARKGLQVTRTGNADNIDFGHMASDVGAHGIAFGVIVFLFGFALLSLLRLF